MSLNKFQPSVPEVVSSECVYLYFTLPAVLLRLPLHTDWCHSVRVTAPHSKDGGFFKSLVSWFCFNRIWVTAADMLGFFLFFLAEQLLLLHRFMFMFVVASFIPTA